MYINNGATCLSVLTEEKFFLGKLDYIQDIKKNSKYQFWLKIFLLTLIKSLYLKATGVIVF